MATFTGMGAGSFADDVVTLRDGSSQSGRVVELGGNRIELELKGGSKSILKREISTVVFDDKREQRTVETSDAVVKRNGHVVRGKVEMLDGGQKVRVTLPAGGSVLFLRKDLQKIVVKGDAVQHDSTVYTGELAKGIEAALAKLRAGPDAEAEKFLQRCGIFAIGRVREALKTSRADSAETQALRRLARIYRLKETVSSTMEEAEPKVYDVLAGGATQSKLDLLSLLFPRFVDDSAGLAEVLAVDPDEEATVRGWAVDYLRRMRKNHELYRIYSRSTGQTQLAAAIALGQNRILIGVPALIEALELESPEIRKLAADSLREVTGKDFQFRADGAPQARKEAARRWLAWWQENEESLSQIAQNVLRDPEQEELLNDVELSPERSAAIKLWKDAGADVEAKLYAHAEVSLKQALDRDPSFFQAYLGLAVVEYAYLNRPQEAVTLLTGLKTKRLSGLKRVDRQWVHLHLGHALRLSGDAASAIAAYEAAIALAPENHQALIALADVAVHIASTAEGLKPDERKEKLKTSLDAAQAAMRVLDKLSTQLVTLRAEDVVPVADGAPFDRRQYNRSVLQLRQSYRAEKQSLWFQRAKILALMGEKKDAMLALKGLVDDLAVDGGEEPKKLEAKARCYLGMLYEEMGQTLFALREFKKVLKDLDPTHPESLRGAERVRRQAQASGTKASN